MYSFRPRQLCALLWASALAAPSSTRLIKACTRLVEQGMSLELFEPHDLSVLVWCCGKVDWGRGRPQHLKFGCHAVLIMLRCLPVACHMPRAQGRCASGACVHKPCHMDAHNTT